MQTKYISEHFTISSPNSGRSRTAIITNPITVATTPMTPKIMLTMNMSI